ncbi:oligosaccharide flippase family protein [Dolichospermum sp. ST_con]|nr:oligosaccharide flippase family protein [Dolichospermum sp. ST_con]MDD1421846.1 oligosaccharide flippase family protein [Dolichospermum sp. ST_sed1]MDD1425200.1 oligosaccharide flippase family protein [Dolichospermum sp. ST_sed9]MDD1432643.1 oligosaccharide flippase family protein [Dolichospermum sp. ST_sed6]MDD1443204.1 oligosaccharide flippase family protein [Dolichospermum sp. ST_sed3]MDD1448865.1 oligosaccharide flippase family protein [Dolichospermum sp. ST_sed8]MDD1456153.1 oligosacc
MGQYKLAKNTFSLLLNRLAQSITSFLLTAAIARNLGAYVLGQYLLAFSYYLIFVSIISQGLKTLFTRELSRKPEEMPVYLVSGTFLQLLLSILGYIVLSFVVWLLPYSSDTSTVCYIMGLTVIPFALSNITEAVFQAQERMNLIAFSTVPVYILRLLVMIWCMQLKYGINYIAEIFLISETLIFVIQWVLVIQIVQPKWQINKDFIWQILKYARTFLAIDALGMIASRTDILLISLLGNELMVGIYGAIGQLQQPFMLVVNSLCLAIFPRMIKAVDKTKENQSKVTENILEILMSITLPFVVGLFFIGGDLLQFIYQESNFSQATLALKISSLALILYPSVRIFNYLLLANGFEKFNLIETAVTTVIGGVSGVILISSYKLMGAALMEVIGSITAFIILGYGVYSRILTLNLWRIMLRPIVISMGMLLVFIIIEKFHFNLILEIIIPVISYSLFTGIIVIQSLGGVSATWNKFFKKGGI